MGNMELWSCDKDLKGSAPPILPFGLHAPERSSCALGDDSSPGKPVQGRRVQLQYHLRLLPGPLWISSDSIDGSDHQKFVGSETGGEHSHIYFTVLDPGVCLSVPFIHPELFDCFS